MRGPREDREARGPREDREARGSRDDRDARGGRDDREGRGRRDERDRNGERGRSGDRVLEEVNRARDDGSREERPRRDRDRDRDERRERYRRQDDLGPSVVGFGDAVPAFMLIPLPRPRRAAETDAEAA